MALLGPFLVALLLVEGCGSGSSQNNNSNDPVNPATVTIASPTNGTTVTTLPEAISLNLLNGATLSGMNITLNGSDITSSFTAGNGNTAQATIDSRVYVGNNRLQVVTFKSF